MATYQRGYTIRNVKGIIMNGKEKLKADNQEKRDIKAHLETIFAHEGEEGQLI